MAQHFRAPARGAFFCSAIVDVPYIAVGTRRALSETNKFAQMFLGTEHAENTDTTVCFLITERWHQGTHKGCALQNINSPPPMEGLILRLPDNTQHVGASFMGARKHTAMQSLTATHKMTSMEIVGTRRALSEAHLVRNKQIRTNVS